MHLRAFAIACAVEIGLRVTTMPRLARALGVPLAMSGRVCPIAGPDLLDPADTARLGAARHVLAAWPFGRNGPCLRRSLTAARLLRHRAASVQLGAARRGGRTVAHAWVVVDGQALDPEAAAFVPVGEAGR